MSKAKSKYEVEELYIDRLDEMGYEYVALKNYDDVCFNFRKQFCKLIGQFMDLINRQIQIEKDKLEAIKQVKKGLLQQMSV